MRDIDDYRRHIENNCHPAYRKALAKEFMEKDKEIERLNSIIKEAREYIENNQEEHRFTDRGGFTYTEGHFLRDSDSLLEILDKVEENK